MDEKETQENTQGLSTSTFFVNQTAIPVTLDRNLRQNDLKMLTNRRQEIILRKFIFV